ncbi:DUF6545 domain-containing protein [Streptomyces clavuligerus]|uniref:DUF6545 domain-containing protein n=1 Tax=Streptomyces clavuligerus TaxID=1901 RepID=D5SK92_STRCL|nr:DUF6545 domain-containing protein [Streptomyces clavuligerus]ANW22266.1 hypothetical protein BB341_28450 [Streptomyces clavuligerus]AXU17162.1 hypothetical protein D1794_31515 [Streptomyces clavuligerus]EFG04335.1 Hypothetical protein SCLAV_p0849 [Streptomyces clavuligerus]MBY6307192.1 hypothetical protein [Streptomyces clavuligerus]QCS10230.1 hypothetical protein CRV15_32210 [Streptomyces clavuligerus]
MSVTDAFSYAIAGLLILQPLLRAKSAWNGHRRERSLWGFFAALAVSWLCRTSEVKALLDRTGVLDLSYLFKHVTAIIGICVLLRYVTAVYAETGRTTGHPAGHSTGLPGDRTGSDHGADHGADRRRSARVSAVVHRIATRASAGTIAVMAATFFFLLHPPDTAAPSFLERHEGDPGLPVYMGLFYLYMGTAAAVCAVQWGGAARVTPVRSVRVGMLMMSWAMALAVVYVLLRTAFVVTVSFTTVPDDISRTQEAVTDSLLYLFSVLWGVGAIAPLARAGSYRYRAVRSLLSLHWLWRDLATAAPDVVRHRPSRLFARLPVVGRPLDTFRDVFTSPDPSLLVRVSRYTVDIRDCIFELRRQAPTDLAERARDHVRSLPHGTFGTDGTPGTDGPFGDGAFGDGTLGDGTPGGNRAHGTDRARGTAGREGHDPEILAEALWIRSALLYRAPSPPGPPRSVPAPYPFDPGTDPRQEVPHLRAVACAYGRVRACDVRAVLARATADCA